MLYVSLLSVIDWDTNLQALTNQRNFLFVDGINLCRQLKQQLFQSQDEANVVCTLR